MRALFAALLLSLGGAVQAAPVTIDFEDAPTEVSLLTVVSNGFTFDYLDFDSTGALPFLGANLLPTNDYLLCPVCGAGGWPGRVGVEFAANNGTVFSLESMDIGSFASTGTAEFYLTAIGHVSGGGQVQLNWSHFATSQRNYSFGSEWSNLTAVEFSVYQSEAEIAYLAFDNIVVDVVPIPAAVWLFGSALLGLGWMRRAR